MTAWWHESAQRTSDVFVFIARVWLLVMPVFVILMALMLVAMVVTLKDVCGNGGCLGQDDCRDAWRDACDVEGHSVGQLDQHVGCHDDGQYDGHYALPYFGICLVRSVVVICKT